MSWNKRLFLALMPDESVRVALSSLQDQLQTTGQWVHPQDLHITLHFLGAVSPAQQKALIEQLDRLSSESFTLNVDYLDYWAKPAIVWAGCSQKNSALTALHRQSGRAVQLAGLKTEKRRYQPHITLVRKAVPIAKQNISAIQWPVHDFHLVESTFPVNPPRYQILESWPLF